MAPFRIEPLSPDHNRDHFDCGVVALNDYLLKQVGQDTRRRITACFVAVEKETRPEFKLDPMSRWIRRTNRFRRRVFAGW